jgi:CRISPR-associated protein Csd2
MPAKDLGTVIDQRYDFVFLFDVKDGNPNGDPDAGNLPRIDPQTLQGFTTDGCIKRKIRNSVEVMKGIESMVPEQDETLNGKLRYEIYFKQQGVLNEINRRAFKALGRG